MAASVVEIWNLALARLGETTVSEENESSAQAALLRGVYAQSRDQMLEEFDWMFARVYGELTPLSDAAELVNGWQFAYEWPTDALAIRGILDPVISEESKIPFEVMLTQDRTEKKIMCDLDGASAKWTVTVEGVHLYPASFVASLSLLLQSEIVGSISKDKNKEVRSIQLMQAAKSSAMVSTANQAVQRAPQKSTPGSIAARA